jgi:hypothetical protein
LIAIQQIYSAQAELALNRQSRIVGDEDMTVKPTQSLSVFDEFMGVQAIGE